MRQTCLNTVKMSQALARQLGKTLRLRVAANITVPSASYHEKVILFVEMKLTIYHNILHGMHVISSLYAVSVLPSVRSIARPSGVQVSVPRISM